MHFSHEGPRKGVLRPLAFRQQSLYRRGHREEETRESDSTCLGIGIRSHQGIRLPCLFGRFGGLKQITQNLVWTMHLKEKQLLCISLSLCIHVPLYL